MEIKKCPFCGGTSYFNRYVDKDENEEYHDFVRVRCSQCDCRSGSVKYNATIHGIDGEYVEVAEKWNRRVDDGREEIHLIHN